MTSRASTEVARKQKKQATTPQPKKEKVVEIELPSKSASPKSAKGIAAKKAPQESLDYNPEGSLNEELLKAFRRVTAMKTRVIKKPPRVSTANFLLKTPAKGKKLKFDLRIHSPGTIGYFLSGGIEPGPALVRLARVKGLDIIGLTDFYDASLLESVQNAAAGTSVCVLPCLDLCCQINGCREVFVTAIFPDTMRGADLTRVLEELRVPKEVRGRKDYCLETPFSEIIEIVERNQGLLLPSRMDKTPYRQSVLKELVETHRFHAFDLVHSESVEYFKERWPAGQFVFFSFSNAESLAQIGSRVTKMKLAEPGFAGVREVMQRRVS